jgi:hypothetical protein
MMIIATAMRLDGISHLHPRRAFFRDDKITSPGTIRRRARESNPFRANLAIRRKEPLRLFSVPPEAQSPSSEGCMYFIFG